MDEGFVLAALIINVLLLVMFIVTVINVNSLRTMMEQVLFPGGRPVILRSCPHCHRQVPASAAVCSFCTRESEPWVAQDGRWWTTNREGKRVYLDPVGRRWVDPDQAS